MKKLLIILTSLFLLTGCFGSGKEIDTKTYASLYPIEFATKYMYGEFSEVSNIYPSGADIETYELSNKQKDIYSNGDIFIYAGVTKEVNLAVNFLNSNSELKIIDATKGVNFTNSVEELWLDPSNYLMIARNIKSTLIDYEKNVYNQDKIEKLYNELKIKISELDVDLTMMGKNATNNTILVSDDAFNYLTKYNINVISLDPDNSNITKSYNDAKKLIQNGAIKYAYVMTGKPLSEDIQNFITSNSLEKLEIDTMYTLSDEQRKNGDDYLDIMINNITKFKTELFR